MIVELVGLPGVGKSFLCRALVRAYAGNGTVRVIVESEREVAPIGISRELLAKLSRAARFALLHVGTTATLVRTVCGRGQSLRRGRLSKLVNLLSETDRSSRVPSGETCINSQGVLQAVWSLDMRSDEPARAELLTALTRWLPEAVVHVEADPAEYETWLRTRRDGRSHFDRLESDGLPAAVERGRTLAHAILEDWASRVSAAHRLDFRNARGARAGDIADWVDGLRTGDDATATAAVARSSAGPVRTPSD